MPVTRISASVDWSVYSGAGAWIGRVSVALIGPASSTGSPMTFMMRPSVPSPTGTAIGRPVSVPSWPRTRPSVASIAIVRTVDSPRCWATSSTRRLPPFLVSSELRIAGRWPSNCTSTTAPMTWVTRPIWLAAVAIDSVSFDRISDRGQLDRDVAFGCLRVRANGVSLFHQRLDLVLVGAGNGDLQFDRERESGIGVQRHVGGDLRGLAVDAVLLGQHQDGLAEAGGIADRKQLLGIVAVAGAAEILWQRPRQRQPVGVELGAAVAAALGGCGCMIRHRFLLRLLRRRR